VSEHPDRDTLDVFVPTRNRAAELAVTLAGLAGQDHPFNVVISDQSDGTPSYAAPAGAAMLSVLASRGRRVEARKHLHRRGPAEHRAALLDRSRARYLQFSVLRRRRVAGARHRRATARGDRHASVRRGRGAVQGMSYVDDHRPPELAPFERWPGRPVPERIEPGTPGWNRWTLHNAANPTHLGRLQMRPGERWVAYKIAWVGGCVLYDLDILDAIGGFGFWKNLPRDHRGEDVLV
jgi:hypothetical protein